MKSLLEPWSSLSELIPGFHFLDLGANALKVPPLPQHSVTTGSIYTPCPSCSLAG